ncbi:MAG: response regulator transcription factor [Hyphomicrobiales bacterium]|nr:response regulator transcription factor [Hyphomicrobiales bacterium]
MGDTAQNGSNVSLVWPAVERRRPLLRAISPGESGSNGRGDLRGVVSQPITTVLIGPSSLFLEGLRHILDKTEFCVLAAKAKAEQWIRRQSHEQGTILFILDGAGEPESASRQVRLLKERHPEAFVVTLIDSNRLADFALLFQAGAKACLAKGVSSSIFLKSLELVLLGETILPSSVLSSMCARIGISNSAEPAAPPQGRLSAQEERILGFLVQGHSNKAIARELAITDSTVKVHVKAILKKIGAQNRTQAAIWATRNPAYNRSRQESEAQLSIVSSPTRADPTEGAPASVQTSLGHPHDDAVVKAPIAAGETKETQVISRTDLLRQASAWREARRVAEEEERRNAIAIKISHLRGLREAGSLQAG